MRATAISVIFILSTTGFSNAASFTCMFGTEIGSPNGNSCTVETTTNWANETTKCRQDYSDTLFGECLGLQPGGTDQLLCYFATPVTPPMDPRIRNLSEQPSVRAVAIELTGTFPPSKAPMVFHYKN